MTDIRAMLAQLLGGEQEQPNLNPGAPVNRPGTRGIFGRRPMGRPATGYADQAPMPPAWAAPSPYRDVAPQQQEMAPGDPSVFMPLPGPSVAPPSQLRSAHVRPTSQDSPASFGNFADYANASLGLQTPPMQADREPWRSPGQTERMNFGDPGRVGGFEPPSAPVRAQPAPFSLEDEAWAAAQQRVGQSIVTDRRRVLDSLPRPGRPLIAQAWSDPNRPPRRPAR